MKIFQNIFLLLIGLFLSHAVAAQTVLTGTVKDKSSGEPLTGANVYVLNATNRSLTGTVVDGTGQFRLAVPSTDESLKVVFSFVGYKTLTVDYTSQRNMNVTLESEAQTIGTAVITATREEVDATGLTAREQVGSAQTITLERLETAPVTNIVDALQGTMSNVDIISGADPGSKARITIRGISSFNANQEPLIVLDGIPFPVVINDDFNFATANEEDYGQLLNISPADLESIRALKDAAATAIYGSRGANGVLEITTKKGQKGRLTVTFASKFDFKKEKETIPLLNANQYVSLMQESIWNTLNLQGYGSTSLTKLLFDTKEINFDPSWAYFNEYNQDVNWADLVTQTGYTSDNNLTVSGGGEKTTYRLSLGYVNEEGTTIGSNFDRFSTSFRMSYRFSDKFMITSSYSFIQGITDSNYSGDKVPSARSSAYNKMPNQSPYSVDSEGRWTGSYFTPYENFQGNFNSNKIINPVALVHESVSKSKKTTNRVSFVAKYTFFPGFDYEGTLGLDINVTKSRGFLPQTVTGVTWIDPLFNKSFDNLSDTFYLYTENKLLFRKNFGEDHMLNVMGSFRTEDQKNSNYSSSVSGNPSKTMIDPVTGGQIVSMGSNLSQTRSVMGNLNVYYEFMRKYAINFGLNMEGNSALGPDARWGVFPNAGMTWHFGDEKWFDSMRDVFTMGKLRLTWGQTGNTPNGTAAYIGTFDAMNPGYINMPAIQPTKIQMDNLDWEVTTQINGGIDLGFFDGRLNATFDVYEKVTRDLLQNKVKIPASTGYSEVAYINAGKMTNQGWEFRINYDIIRNTDWGLNVDFNISQNQNKINELPDFKLDSDYSFKNGEYASKVVIGNAIGSFYGYKYQGVYQNTQDTYMKDANGNVVTNLQGLPIAMTNGGMRVYPGDAKYQDTNGDGNIDKYDVVYLGNSNPSTIGGFSFNLRYKGWGLSGNFAGRFGQKAINQVRIDNENMYNKNNQSTKVLERWRNEGDQTDIPRALYNYGYNYLGSDRFIEDASFVRLKTLTLKYVFPKEMLSKIKLSQLTVYVTAYDLWTISGYSGLDPEVSTSGGYFPLAKDSAMAPRPLRFAAGLTLTF